MIYNKWHVKVEQYSEFKFASKEKYQVVQCCYLIQHSLFIVTRLGYSYF